MKRTVGTFVLLAAVGGCASSAGGPPWGGGGQGGGFAQQGVGRAPAVPGVMGPHGQPVAMAAPYSSSPPGEAAARAMLSQSIPMDMVAPMPGMPGVPGGIVPANFNQAMPGAGPHQGPVMPVGHKGGGGMPPPFGAVAAGGGGGGPAGPMQAKRSEIRFAAPAGMKVSWFAPCADGKPGFAPNQLEVPGRYNFVQGAIYRLKLSDIPNRPGVDLYPTIEVVPCNYKTDAFLAHSAVPISFTEEDFEQIASGNYLVKVIYLPDPAFQDVASTGPDEVVSTRLEPGVDPIVEASKRGSILVIVRVGNIDLEAPNTPPMDAPSPYGGGKPVMPHAAMMPGMPGPGGMMMGQPAANVAGAPKAMPNVPALPNTPPAQTGAAPKSPSVGPALGPVSQVKDSGIQQAGYQAPRSVRDAAEAAQEVAAPPKATKGSWWGSK